jgi:hypothetical protein
MVAAGHRRATSQTTKVRLLDTLERFCACGQLAQVKHPFFGHMLCKDWTRWGYLHADHHLRQFGV